MGKYERTCVEHHGSKSLVSRRQSFESLAYGLVVVITITAFLCVHNLTSASKNYLYPSKVDSFQHVIDNNQYAYLADSLIHGQFTLNLEVPESLAALDNPYDYNSRYELSTNEDVNIYWDYAFYNGKYYCYFGVLPAILLYAPYQIITGKYLNTPDAIAILGTLAILSIALLIHRLANKYFLKILRIEYKIIGYLIFMSASNIFYLGFVSRFYSVPILTSITLTTLGLSFWLNARKSNAGEVALSAFDLCAGSVCMVANFGSRPQFLLASFFAFPIFFKEIFKERILFSKESIKETISAIIPIPIVLAPFLAYNYIRFGSCFDFGSNYNLTGFDMIHYVQPKRTTLALIFYYLFQPPSIDANFPFVHSTNLALPFGWAPNEPMFGGIIWLAPNLIIISIFPVLRHELKKRGLLGICHYSFFAFFVLIILDTTKAGVTQRYFSDFSWYLAVISIMILWTLVTVDDRNGLSLNTDITSSQGHNICNNYFILLKFITCFSLLISILMGGLSFLSNERYDSFGELNPVLYQYVTDALTINV